MSSDIVKNNIYEPSDDTFLLIEAIEILYSSGYNPSLCLEVGIGSGIICNFISSIFKCPVIGTDLNPNAVNYAKMKFTSNETSIHLLYGNLGSNLRSGIFDLILFNPPYIPCEIPSIYDEDYFEKIAWSGGINGSEVLISLIKDCKRLLISGGKALIILFEGNLPYQILKQCRNFDFLKSSNFLIERKRCGIEKLYVIELTRK